MAAVVLSQGVRKNNSLWCETMGWRIVAWRLDLLFFLFIHCTIYYYYDYYSYSGQYITGIARPRKPVKKDR